MSLIVKSLSQSLMALFQVRMLLLLFGIPALTVFLLLIVYAFFWSAWMGGLTGLISSLWGYSWFVESTGFLGLGSLIAGIFLVLLFIPLAFVISVSTTSVVAMPFVLEFVAKDYPQVRKIKTGSLMGSISHTFKEGGVFLFWLVITLPLWLIPGLQIIVPLYLSARFNRNVFMYDVLQDYTTESVRKEIVTQDSTPLTVLGVILGALAYIPFAFIILPVLSALAFTYYGFNKLSKLESES